MIRIIKLLIFMWALICTAPIVLQYMMNSNQHKFSLVHFFFIYTFFILMYQIDLFSFLFFFIIFVLLSAVFQILLQIICLEDSLMDFMFSMLYLFISSHTSIHKYTHFMLHKSMHRIVKGFILESIFLFNLIIINADFIFIEK